MARILTKRTISASSATQSSLECVDGRPPASKVACRQRITSGAIVNFRRGFIRLWAVASTLFAIGVSVVAGTVAWEQFERRDAIAKFEKSGAKRLFPVPCGQARGTAEQDYTPNVDKTGPWNKYAQPGRYTLIAPPKTSDNCWYTISKFRPLYPEYSDVEDEDLARRLYKAIGQPLPESPNPWFTLGWGLGIALGAPLGVLALGAALAWVLAGFVTKEGTGAAK